MYVRDCGLLEEIGGALGEKEEVQPEWRSILAHIAQQQILIMNDSEYPRLTRSSIKRTGVSSWSWRALPTIVV